MASVFEPRLQAAIAAAGLGADVADSIWLQRDRLAAIALPQGLPLEAAVAARDAVHEAFVAGYRWIMVASAGLCVWIFEWQFMHVAVGGIAATAALSTVLWQ